jgi:WD40 repeat protein
MQLPAPFEIDRPSEAGTRVVPDHQLVRRIGQGSYGDVWLAKSMMGTFRAIKFVERKNFKEERPYQRELEGIRKFEPISRSHEGLIDVLHVGINEAQGYFYYVMELGDDQNDGQAINPDKYQPKTLATELQKRGRLPVAECLHMGLALAHAVHQLHTHNLVHRDIKPSNIIFVNGVPKLADIGLVMDIGEARSYVGTEGFIPPEGPRTPAADIYSLGKVLYELCTGKDRHHFPALPKELDTFGDAAAFLELNEVIIRACHADPAKRYASARDLHADLVLLENGKSVHRLRVLENRLGQIKKIAAGVLLVGTLTSVLYFETARKRRESAEFRQRQVGAQLAFGTQALESGDYSGALSYFIEAMHLDEGNTLQENTHRTRIKSVAERCPKIVQMFFGDKQASAVEFDSSGTRLLITAWFGKAQIWDIASGEPISPLFGPKETLSRASFSPKDDRVVTAGENGQVALWDAKTGKELLQMLHPDSAMNARFSRDGQWIVSACADKRARVFDANTGALKTVFGDHNNWVLDASFSPDGQWLLTASSDSTAQVWNVKTGERHGPPLPHHSWVFSACFSPDGQRILTSSFDRHARQWNFATFTEIQPAMMHEDAVRSAHYSPDGRFIVTASWDKNVKIWDAATGQLVKPNGVLRHSGRGVMHATFAPDGRRIATGCIDGTARIWELAGSEILPGQLPGKLAENSPILVQTNHGIFRIQSAQNPPKVLKEIPVDLPIVAATLSRHGEFLLALLRSSDRNLLQIWSATLGSTLYEPMTCTNTFDQVCLSNKGDRLAIHGGTHLRLIELVSGEEKNLEIAHGSNFCIFSPDDEMLLLAGGHEISLINFSEAKLVLKPLKQSGPVKWATFSPDGQRMVICSGDDTLNEGAALLWSVSGELIAKLDHSDGVLKASFSPNGRLLATCSEDFTARVWDATTGNPLTARLKHADQVLGCAFSTDGQWLATASADRTARIWDAHSGEPVTPPFTHALPLNQVWLMENKGQLIARDFRGNHMCWQIPRETAALPDLQNLAGFFTGYANGETQKRGRRIENEWEYLKRALPGYFTVAVQKIEAWHLRQINSSATRKDPAAMDFHKMQIELLTRP